MKKKLLSLALALALVLTSAITPAFAATTADLKQQRETEHFVFYCMDQDVKALDDLAEALEGCYERTTTDLGKAPSGKVKVNIYPDIDSFHNAMGRPNDPDWSVGEAKNGALYMTSPLNPGPSHDYDGMLQIAVHEFVHIIINLFGNVPSYLHEGVACYEAGQNDYQSLSAFITEQMDQNKVPSLSSLEKFNSSSEGMYQYGPAFVDFIARAYGFDAVVALLEGKSLATAIGKDGASMQNQSFNEYWWKFLSELYVKDDGLTECMETENFVLLFSSQDSEAASELASKLEECRGKTVTGLKISSNMKQIIRIYPNSESFHKAAYLSNLNDGNTLRVVYNSAIYCISPDNFESEGARKNQIGNIVRQSEQILLYEVAPSLPHYLSWGISYHEAGATFSGVKEWIKKQADAGDLPTLTELKKNSCDNVNLYGYIYVEFVAQTLGYKNLNDNLASLVKGESPETVFGMTSQEMESAWQAFLKDYDRMALAPNLDTASTWARAGIVSAVKDGLVPAGLQDNYKDMITRSQFAALSVALYEAMSGETAPAPGENPFSDTDDPVVLQANALGIVKGSGGKFAPNDLVTRQEMALMLSRVYTKLGGTIPQAASTTFADDGDISPWTGLKEAIAFMSDKGILKGTDGKYNPKSNASIQEAIAVALRMFENLDV